MQHQEDARADSNRAYRLLSIGNGSPNRLETLVKFPPKANPRTCFQSYPASGLALIGMKNSNYCWQRFEPVRRLQKAHTVRSLKKVDGLFYP